MIYYVISLKSEKVVKDVTQEFLSYLVHYKHLLTINSFAKCETLKEARKIRQEVGGVIFMGAE